MITSEELLKKMHEITRLDKQMRILDLIVVGILAISILLKWWIWVLLAALVLLHGVIMKHKTRQSVGFKIHRTVKNLFNYPEQCSTIAFNAMSEDKEEAPIIYKHLRTIKNTDPEEVRIQAVWSALKESGALKE